MRLPQLVGLTLLTTALAFLAHAEGQTVSKDKEKVQETIIHIEDLDCEACAVAVEVSLEEVAGVAKATTDVDKKIAIVTPKAKASLSEKALWQAVEDAGFTPTKLVSAAGTFTKQALFARVGGKTDAKGTAAKSKEAVKEMVIHIEDLDCEACAVAVEVSLEEVAGVAKATTDVDKKIAIVTPKAKAILSEKALWQAVEDAGFTPTKLIGPSGTFTKKPSEKK